MPLGSTYALGPALAGNAANIVAAATPAAAGALPLVGGATVALDVARKVLVTWGAEVAAHHVTIKGTGFPPFGQALSSGPAISEVVTTTSGAGSTKTTVQDFATITSVSVDGAFQNNLSLGTQSAGNTVGKPVLSSPWFHVDALRNPVDIGYGINGAGFTNGYILEVTFDDPNAGYEAVGPFGTPASSMPQSNVPPFIASDPGFGAALKTTNFVGSILFPYMAIRLSLYDTGAAVSCQFQVLQAGLQGA